jgi:Arc/MetJ family transcription regulator
MKFEYLTDADTKAVHANAAYTKELIRVTEFEIHHTLLSETYRLNLLHERKEYYEQRLLTLVKQALNIEAGLDNGLEVA